MPEVIHRKKKKPLAVQGKHRRNTRTTARSEWSLKRQRLEGAPTAQSQPRRRTHTASPRKVSTHTLLVHYSCRAGSSAVQTIFGQIMQEKRSHWLTEKTYFSKYLLCIFLVHQKCLVNSSHSQAGLESPGCR